MPALLITYLYPAIVDDKYHQLYRYDEYAKCRMYACRSKLMSYVGELNLYRFSFSINAHNASVEAAFVN
jgi:hypothetical protein